MIWAQSRQIDKTTGETNKLESVSLFIRLRQELYEPSVHLQRSPNGQTTKPKERGTRNEESTQKESSRNPQKQWAIVCNRLRSRTPHWLPNHQSWTEHRAPRASLLTWSDVILKVKSNPIQVTEPKWGRLKCPQNQGAGFIWTVALGKPSIMQDISKARKRIWGFTEASLFLKDFFYITSR